MPAPYTPLIPFFTYYPFLRVASLLLDEEYNDIKDFLQSEGEIEKQAREIGKNRVISIFRDIKPELSLSDKGFICENCEEIECMLFCPNKAIGERQKSGRRSERVGERVGFREINWELCNLCGECFRNCKENEAYEDKFKAKKSILSYLFSRLIVNLTEEWVRRRYAIKEARRYSELIENEDDARKKYVLGILSADLGIKADISELSSNSIKVHVSSYLRASSRIKSEKWRLINQDLIKGYVELTESDYIRVIEEFLRDRLVEKIEIDDEVKKILEPYLKEIEPIIFSEKEKIGKVKFDKIETECFPPCMKKILSDLKAGINLPHTARFAITSFLINIGLDVDDVMALFRSAPDFREDLTRYQVEHIAGAKGTEYDCPACDTMRTYHNCYVECKTYHPLSKYEECMRRLTYKTGKKKTNDKKDKRDSHKGNTL